MKPLEIKNSLNALYRVVEREEALFKEKTETRFTPTVAIAIAKNRKILEEEIKTLASIEEKNKKIAETKKKKLEELGEQKELMNSDIEVEIKKVSFEEVEKSKELTSSDYFDLLFMVE